MKKIEKELKTFYIFILGQFVSQLGSRITSCAVGLWAYKESGKVLSIAVLTACYLVPEICLNFIAGSISDRFNKKKIMLIADTIAACTSVALLFLLISGNMEIEYLYLINIVLGVADAFQSTASEVAISLIVSKKHYIKISGLQSLSSSFINILYPIIATSMYAFVGLIPIVCIDLFTFVFAFITLLFGVKIKEHKVGSDEEEGIIKKCLLGIKYIFNTTGIKELIIFMAFINLIVAMYDTILTPMVLSRTNQNDVQLGIVTSMVGIAGILGSRLVFLVKDVKHRMKMSAFIMAFSMLICNSLLGIGRNYIVWTIAIFLGNILIPIFTANISYVMRVNIPIEMQGRVFSARNTLQYFSIPVGNLLGGFLADKVFEPFMMNKSFMQEICSVFVGKGTGSGIALLLVVLALIGFIGCSYFGINKNMNSLDK